MNFFESDISGAKPSIAKTLIVATAIFTFGCKKPLHNEGANMGEKPKVAVEVKNDTHQEEVLKTIPQLVKTPNKVPKKVKLEGETIDMVVGPTAPLGYKGSR